MKYKPFLLLQTMFLLRRACSENYYYFFGIMSMMQYIYSFNNNKLSFRDSVLSKYISELLNGIRPHMRYKKWCIIKRVTAYKGNPFTDKLNCMLLLRKSVACSPPRVFLLNKRSELVTKCFHENKFFVTNYRTHCFNLP